MGVGGARESEARTFRLGTEGFDVNGGAAAPNSGCSCAAQGRMKFTRPLYRQLYALEETRNVAIQTFVQRSSFYHPICRSMVAKDLGVELGESRGKACVGRGKGRGGWGVRGRAREKCAQFLDIFSKSDPCLREGVGSLCSQGYVLSCACGQGGLEGRQVGPVGAVASRLIVVKKLFSKTCVSLAALPRPEHDLEDLETDASKSGAREGGLVFRVTGPCDASNDVLSFQKRRPRCPASPLPWPP